MKKRTVIDMGASAIRVLAPGSEEIAWCPAIAALECASGKPIAFGYEARLNLKRMPGSGDTVYPLLEPESVTSTVLEGLFACAAELAHASGRFHTDLILSIPGSIDEDLEGAYPEAASAVGAKDVYVVNGLHAASRGVKLAASGQTAIVHVGASSAEIGIFAERDCLISKTVAVGGHTYDDLLGDYIYDQFGLLLDSEGAEDAKIRLSALDPHEKTLTVSGIHRKTGLPRTMTLEASILRSALKPAFEYLTAPLSEMMGQTGEIPVLVILTGGSAPLCGLREAFAALLPDSEVVIAPDPADAVIRGLHTMIRLGEVG